MRDPDTAAAVIQLQTAWVPRRRARAVMGAPPRGRRPRPGRRSPRWTRSGLASRSRASRRSLTGEMRNSGMNRIAFLSEFLNSFL